MLRKFVAIGGFWIAWVLGGSATCRADFALYMTATQGVLKFDADGNRSVFATAGLADPVASPST